MKRRFNRAERFALAFVAGNRCEICGCVLEDFHADHIKPFSCGGETVMENGQALCPSCNLRKGNKMSFNTPIVGSLSGLREWQVQAATIVNSRINAGNRSTTIAACPGAGKTHFALTLAKDLLRSRKFDAAVIVAPTRIIKAQWSNECAAVGMSSISSLSNSEMTDQLRKGGDILPPDRQAMVFTYSQIAISNEAVAAFELMCKRHKILVFLDEVHHAADEESFGKRLLVAFDSAKHVVCLTGTPFNTKGSNLAFVDSKPGLDEEGNQILISDVHYSYSYAEALSADDVVRPIQFIKAFGRGEFTYQNADEVKTKVIDFEKAKKTDRITPMLQFGDGYIESLIDRGMDELNGINQHDDSAAMLIVAMDGDHAQAIAQYLKEQHRETATVLMHDVPKAHETMANFAKAKGDKRSGYNRVLVAVRMVSEGANIKRLRVGVYATNYITRMFFIQWVGRFIRYEKRLDESQYAVAVIPAHVELLTYAEEIEQMIVASGLPNGDGGDGEAPGPSDWLMTNSDAEYTREEIMYRGETAAADIIELANMFLTEHPDQTGLLPKKKLGEFLVLTNWRGSGHVASTAPVVDKQSNERKKNNKAVRRLAMAMDRSSVRCPEGNWFSYLNSKANRMVGIDGMDNYTPTEVLIDRRKKIVAWASQQLGVNLNEHD